MKIVSSLKTAGTLQYHYFACFQRKNDAFSDQRKLLISGFQQPGS
jgi:hypothetical protein